MAAIPGRRSGVLSVVMGIIEAMGILGIVPAKTLILDMLIRMEERFKITRLQPIPDSALRTIKSYMTLPEGSGSLKTTRAEAQT
jgi:hypothetical protein